MMMIKKNIATRRSVGLQITKRWKHPGNKVIANLPRRTKQLVSSEIGKTYDTPNLAAIAISENGSFSLVKVDVIFILSVNTREEFNSANVYW